MGEGVHCAPLAHVREGNPELPEVAAQLQKDRSRASLSVSKDWIGSPGISLVTKTGAEEASGLDSSQTDSWSIVPCRGPDQLPNLHTVLTPLLEHLLRIHPTPRTL